MPEVRQQQLDRSERASGADEAEHDLRPGGRRPASDRAVGREQALEVGDLEVVGDPMDLGRDVLADRPCPG